MNKYEIRIVRREDRSKIAVIASLLGDYAAVRRARMLAGQCDQVEVWRDGACVYASNAEAASVF